MGKPKIDVEVLKKVDLMNSTAKAINGMNNKLSEICHKLLYSKEDSYDKLYVVNAIQEVVIDGINQVNILNRETDKFLK